jgi:hypothetical protein
MTELNLETEKSALSPRRALQVSVERKSSQHHCKPHSQLRAKHPQRFTRILSDNYHFVIRLRESIAVHIKAQLCLAVVQLARCDEIISHLGNSEEV